MAKRDDLVEQRIKQVTTGIAALSMAVGMVAVLYQVLLREDKDRRDETFEIKAYLQAVDTKLESLRDDMVTFRGMWQKELYDVRATSDELRLALSRIPEDTSATLAEIAQAEVRLRELIPAGSPIQLSADLEEKLKSLSQTRQLVVKLQTRVDELGTVASGANEQLNRISALILDKPEKVLTLLLLREELEGIETQLAALKTQIISQENSLDGRIGMLQWVIGTVFIALLAVVAQVFLPQLRRQHHPPAGRS